MSKTDDKAVARKPDGTLAVPDFGDYEGQGFEGQTGADIVLPFIGVLQALSPQVTEKPGEGGLEGAKVGMLHNTVTDDLYDGEAGLEFIPATTEHCFVEWVPRKQGGGFVARHEADSDVVARAKESAEAFNKLKTEAGNDLVETFYVYGVVVVDEQPIPVVIAFTSTKIKVYKKWNTKVNMFTVQKADGSGKVRPPLFAHRVLLTTVREKNAEGEFRNFALAPAEPGGIRDSLLAPDDPRFQAALEVRRMIAEGTARASYETQAASSGGDPAARDGGDDTPF